MHALAVMRACLSFMSEAPAAYSASADSDDIH